ncbi:MAG: hypothetical protein UY92_C0006G0065 [Candidatus Magasanikbacteria bacterium GW2011_GWA2_56_11]|uniref:DNA 3'-5' helicase n=1 Tax=Candidatus Magasanikbacteria bacterium GW2011_GWA2_56_11 TaxID=1619044 RepID=A0A0G2BAH3_9BACT|nr:MAG: hypothetical protein UY92_C0006G0065 [Candidatus Magasanikbacteria bacterium GW2011_GWA2_56_11]
MTSKNLNQSQRAAVEYVDGPLLIVAGAGTGKTTVITEKIVRLISSGRSAPENILALTFTDKAAAEMQERVDSRLDTGYVDLSISTFHAFCERLLESYGLAVGLPTRFKILSATEAWILVHDHLYDFNLDYYRPLGNPTKHIHELIRHFSKCKDELVNPEDYLRHAEAAAHDSGDANVEEGTRLKEIANAYHTYNRLLLESGALDFGDLIYYAVRLLSTRPQIKAELQRRYRYILVDEFQDVNWAQYELVRLLSEAGQLTVVGDDDQSIYAFRGASVANILRFKDDYPQAREVVLNENYRSGQEILDVAYASIQHNNPDRLEVKLGVDKKLQSTTGGGKAKVVHAHKSSLDDEVAFVVNEIVKLKAADGGASWNDFAILARANNHLEPFIQALERAHIPYEWLSASGLFRQPIVLDVFNFFKAVDHYHESAAVYRLLGLPCLDLSENDRQKFTAAAKKKSVSYYEGLKLAAEWGLSAPGTAAVGKILELIHAGMRAARTEKPSVILYRFLEGSGYLGYLSRQEGEGNSSVIRQIYQLKQFFEFLSRYEDSVPDHSIGHFVAYLSTVIESGDEGRLYQPADTPDSVNLMSVHGAKGLEFRYVFIVNLVEDRFPARNRGEGIELPLALINERLPEGDYLVAEERRLFYVALTRARERAYLTGADSYGGVRKKKISRFVAELGGILGNTDETPGADAGLGRAAAILPRGREADEAQKTAPQYRLPDAFSFSQIKAYETCPYQYKLAHILKIPTKGSASFSFGQTMHAALQRFYERVRELNSATQGSLFAAPAAASLSGAVKAPSLAELLQYYEEAWIPDWYRSQRQREEYYAQGKDILKRFYAAEDGNWTVPVALESWFKIKVGNYLVHGRIDRVDQLADGTLQIIDYKTGKSKEKLAADDKAQLLVYQMAAETLSEYRHMGATSKLTFYYLNDIIQTSFVGRSEELERVRNKITAAIDQISAGQFGATPGPHVCQHCDFRDICEFRVL